MVGAGITSTYIVPDVVLRGAGRPLRSLDYPGIGPEHSFLKDVGRAEYFAVTDEEALEGFQLLSKWVQGRGDGAGGRGGGWERCSGLRLVVGKGLHVSECERQGVWGTPSRAAAAAGWCL